MKRCPTCGREYPDSTNFCVKCGTKLTENDMRSSYGDRSRERSSERIRSNFRNPEDSDRERDRDYDRSEDQYRSRDRDGDRDVPRDDDPHKPHFNVYVNTDSSRIPEEYTPISMWGYFGYELLFSIPIVGFILLIVFSVSATNKNLKNFARSYFCLLIIVMIILFIVLGVAGASLLFI